MLLSPANCRSINMFTVTCVYVCCMCVVCVLYVCCMCVVCVLYVCCMCVVCVLYVCCMCVVCVLYVYSMAQQPLRARASSLSRLYDHTPLDKPHSVGLLWRSDQPHTVTYILILESHKIVTLDPIVK